MSDLTLAFLWVFIFVSIYLTMFWVIVFSYKFTELLESYLNKSKYVEHHRIGLSSIGLPGKVLRSGTIAILFFFPRFFEGRGLIEKNELSNVPLHLKRKLLAAFITLWIVFFAFVFLGLWTKYNYSTAV